MSVRAKDTLGFGSGMVIHPDPIHSVILVDARATSEQQQALAAFALSELAKWLAKWCGSRRRRSTCRSTTSTWRQALGGQGDSGRDAKTGKRGLRLLERVEVLPTADSGR